MSKNYIMIRFFFLILLFINIAENNLSANTIIVGVNQTYTSIQSAYNIAKPGDTILVNEGIYTQTEYLSGTKGNDKNNIYVISKKRHGAIYRGGSEAWHLSSVSYIVIEGFVFEQQTGNGVNMDDSGSLVNPSTNIAIIHCIFRDIKATGNNDLLKLSGLDFFSISECTFLNGSLGSSGSGIDMVGCHNGRINKCTFENMGANSIQMKGGSQYIRIEKNFFKKGGQRAINIGGSTGLAFFRPQNATFEAADINVWSNIFIESDTPIAFVGCIRSKVVNNTIINPVIWIFRILQETVDPNRFDPCGLNEFTNNIVYFPNTLRTIVNIGPNTDPSSFIFSNNLWYNHQNPSFNQYNLPVAETGSIKGKDPLFVNLAQENFNLLKSSPAIGQGKSVIAPIEDYNGNLFEITNRSIGAIEFQKVSNNDDLNTSSMLVYPNPSKGLIHIISDLIKGELLKITIYSIQGNFIKSIPINTTTNPSIDLQMNDGTYMYIIEDSKKNILKRSLLLISK